MFSWVKPVLSCEGKDLNLQTLGLSSRILQLKQEHHDSGVLFLDNSKTCVKWPLSERQKIGFQDQLSLNAGQEYYRMLQGEHSAILSTFIKLQCH